MPVFPTTRQSVIAAAREGDAPARSRALETLATVYWRPIYSYVRLKWGRNHDEAAELTQDFFARLIEKDLLGRYEAGKSRLRTYLRVCIDGFVSNEFKAASRMKRGGGTSFLPLDLDTHREELETLVSSWPETPERAFEKEWTRSLFTLALDRMREDLSSRGKAIPFQLFEICDLGSAEGTAPSYAELAARFEISESNVTNGLASARREFRRHVLGVLREMTGSESEFRQEARSLLGVEAR